MILPARELSIFVPAYNEEHNLEGAVRDILEAASAVCDDFEILIVNDGSRDGTSAVAEGLAAADPRITAIHNPVNMGMVAGYRKALARARFPYFTFLPGDREVAAASIRAIFEAIGTAQIVVPYHANPRARALHRRFLTWTFTKTANAVFGLRLPYYQGPCVYPTELARSLVPWARGRLYFLAEMLVRALKSGRTFVAVGLQHQKRAHGKAHSVSLSTIKEALAMVGRVWWDLNVRRRKPPVLAEPASEDLLRPAKQP